MGEMVLDGGRRFIPAGIVGSYTLSLLLAFLVAHDRVTEDRTERWGRAVYPCRYSWFTHIIFITCVPGSR